MEYLNTPLTLLDAHFNLEFLPFASVKNLLHLDSSLTSTSIKAYFDRDSTLGLFDTTSTPTQRLLPNLLPHFSLIQSPPYFNSVTTSTLAKSSIAAYFKPHLYLVRFENHFYFDLIPTSIA